MAKMVTVTIDGIRVSAPEGELLIETAKRIGQHVPNFCYHSKLAPAGLCRMCLVRIEGQPKLQIGCNTRVTDGMAVDTVSEPVITGRRAQLEFLLLNHPLDCPICDKGGECDLQDYTVAYGDVSSRSGMPKLPKPKAVDLGPTIVLDEQRCVLCQRCVRFDDEITSERSLVTAARGVDTIIATEGDRPYVSYFTGNTTELCPVGALTSKTYRFKARPWDLRPTLTTCTQCPVGCSAFADSRFDELLRMRYDQSTVDPHLDPTGDWLCDRGRYNIGFLGDQRRLTQPMVRSGDDQWIDLAWNDAIGLIAVTLKDAVENFGPQSIGAIGGGRLTNEEAYLLQYLVRGLGSANVDYRTHGELTANAGRYAAALHDLDDADVILEIGADTVEQAPVLDLRVRYAVRNRNAELAYLGDVKPSWPIPFHHVVAGGNAAAILDTAAANVRHEEDLSKRADEPPAVGLARLLRGGERVVVIWDGKDAATARSIEGLIAALRERDKRAGLLVVGHAPNARGAEAMGVHPALLPGYQAAPHKGLDTEGMLRAAARGELKALLIFGANPFLSYPNGVLVRSALGRVPFLVTSELFMTETAVRSHVVLPVRASQEKAGHTTALDGTVKKLQPACRPQSGQPLSDREIFFLLADAIGMELPDEAELERLATTLPASDAQRALGPSAPAFVVETAPSSGGGEFTVRAVPRLYAGGGTSAHDRTLDTLRPQPTAFVNVADAERLGLEDSDVVELRNALGALGALSVEVGERVSAGTVGVIAELSEAPANALSDGGDAVRADLKLVTKGARVATFAGAQGA